MQLDVGRLAFVDTAAARERYQRVYGRVKQRMNPTEPRRIVARDKTAFVMGTLGLTYAALGCAVAHRMLYRVLLGCALRMPPCAQQLS